MINANELRIGNLVNVPHGNVQIDYFLKDTGAHFSDGCGGTWGSLEPIPLSPEILDKCGFVKSEHDDELWQHDDMEIMLYNNQFYQSANLAEYKIGKAIKYVHQLQNMFFSLNDKELQINL